MLNRYISLLLGSVLLVMTSCQSVTYNGATSLKDKSFESLTINGHAVLRNVTVDDVATFSSALEAYKSTFNVINSVASVECHECVIKNCIAASLKAYENSQIDKAEIKNDISAEGSLIDEIIFAGSEGIFKNTKIKSIKNTGYANKRVIVLIDSEVSGDISFESTDGCKVILKGSSKIRGQVNNGVVEQQP